MRGGLVLLLLVLMFGCEKTQPTVAHGKPLPEWVEALHSPDARTRKKAAAVLGKIGAVDPAVVPALTEAMHDRDPAVRAEAALALMKMGPAAHDAAPALAEAQKDAHPTVRRYAARALERIRGDSP
jgi:HEAT repeat protein